MPDPISAFPALPNRGGDPTTFSTQADAFLAHLNTFVAETNALATSLNTQALSATSSSSVALALGAASFTVETGKSFLPGMRIKAAATGKWVIGDVSSYNPSTGVLVLDVIYFSGTGSASSWNLFLALEAYDNETFGINAVIDGGQLNIWGDVAKKRKVVAPAEITVLSNAPYAGASMVLYLEARVKFFTGANLKVLGGDATLNTGDMAYVLALTTSSFVLVPMRGNGWPAASMPAGLPNNRNYRALEIFAAGGTTSTTLIECYLRDPVMNAIDGQRRLFSFDGFNAANHAMQKVSTLNADAGTAQHCNTLYELVSGVPSPTVTQNAWHWLFMIADDEGNMRLLIMKAEAGRKYPNLPSPYRWFVFLTSFYVGGSMGTGLALPRFVKLNQRVLPANTVTLLDGSVSANTLNQLSWSSAGLVQMSGGDFYFGADKIKIMMGSTGNDMGVSGFARNFTSGFVSLFSSAQNRLISGMEISVNAVATAAVGSILKALDSTLSYTNRSNWLIADLENVTTMIYWTNATVATLLLLGWEE